MEKNNNNDKPVLWIWTTNKGKIEEYKLLASKINYQLKNIALHYPKLDIKETGLTFSENALLKATALSKIIDGPVIADDSGLEILGLNGWPGIYSARWKEGLTFSEANAIIVEKCRNLIDRTCYYKCALAFVDPHKNIKKVFVGQLKGKIATKQFGDNGFGYDPIFYLPEYHATCAELGIKIKNKISHRAEAWAKFLKWWKEYNK